MYTIDIYDEPTGCYAQNKITLEFKEFTDFVNFLKITLKDGAIHNYGELFFEVHGNDCDESEIQKCLNCNQFEEPNYCIRFHSETYPHNSCPYHSGNRVLNNGDKK